MSEEKKASRRGGLGKGLAALIPTAPADQHSGGSMNQPRVGDEAADIIFGPKKSTRGSNEYGANHPYLDSGSTKTHNRHSDEISDDLHPGENRRKASVQGATGRKGDVSRETTPRDGSGEEASAIAEFGASYRELPVDAIVVNENQPRQVFEEEPLQELAHSIKEFGLLQPIVVRPLVAVGQHTEIATDAAQPQFEIIMGERRWRATKLAGLDTIPAIVRETADENMLRDALLENIHRVQLNPLEEAAAYQQLLEEFGVTQAELAQRLGRSRPVITNMIRLLQLPTEVQRRVAAGVLSAGHARALLGLKTGAEDQTALANRIVAEGLSVRATEEAVTLLNRGEKTTTKQRKTAEQPEILHTWADRLANVFDTKVTAQMGKRKGRVVIEFSDLDDFDRIMALMESAGKTEE